MVLGISEILGSIGCLISAKVLENVIVWMQETDKSGFQHHGRTRLGASRELLLRPKVYIDGVSSAHL